MNKMTPHLRFECVPDAIYIAALEDMHKPYGEDEPNLIRDPFGTEPDLDGMPDWMDMAPPVASCERPQEVPIDAFDIGVADEGKANLADMPSSATALNIDLGAELKPVPYVPGEGWPDPDMTLIRPERPPAPMLSDEDFAEIFGPWAGWIKAAAKAKGVPDDYVALALLCAASACIGNARWACPWPSWKEPPILWGMLVGNPSAGKSPALDAVLEPLREIERGMDEAFNSRRAKWETENEIASLVLSDWKSQVKKAVGAGDEPPEKPNAADAGPPPLRERITITDATTEKVAELLASNGRGLMLKRDELSGWIEGMNRYNDGGDRPFWLEAFGGRSFTVDRKSRPDPIIVERLLVGVLGGTQPDKLDGLIRTADDGLLARHLIVFPDLVPLSRPSERVDEGRLKAALEKLRGLAPCRDEHGNMLPLLMHFADNAADKLQEFRLSCRDWETDTLPLFRGHVGKMPGIAVRVACVLAHLDWASALNAEMPSMIEANHMDRARRLVGDHFRLHAYRAYGANEFPEEVRNAQRIARIIGREKPLRLTARDVQRRTLAGMQTAQTIEKALTVLEAADWVRKSTEPTGGRPRTFYLVNPKIIEQDVPVA